MGGSYHWRFDDNGYEILGLTMLKKERHIVKVDEDKFDKAIHELKQDLPRLVRKMINDFYEAIVQNGNGDKKEGR